MTTETIAPKSKELFLHLDLPTKSQAAACKNEISFKTEKNGHAIRLAREGDELIAYANGKRQGISEKNTQRNAVGDAKRFQHVRKTKARRREPGLLGDEARSRRTRAHGMLQPEHRSLTTPNEEQEPTMSTPHSLGPHTEVCCQGMRDGRAHFEIFCFDRDLYNNIIVIQSEFAPEKQSCSVLVDDDGELDPEFRFHPESLSGYVEREIWLRYNQKFGAIMKENIRKNSQPADDDGWPF